MFKYNIMKTLYESYVSQPSILRIEIRGILDDENENFHLEFMNFAIFNVVLYNGFEDYKNETYIPYITYTYIHIYI
jgi:hypothetical protein